MLVKPHTISQRLGTNKSINIKSKSQQVNYSQHRESNHHRMLLLIECAVQIWLERNPQQLSTYGNNSSR